MDYRIAVASQLASHLKSLRKQANLTQQELGERLGLSQRMVAKLEAHPERASFERVLMALSVLDADLTIKPRRSTEQTAKRRAPSGLPNVPTGSEADEW